jgi:hypothetical protein
MCSPHVSKHRSLMWGLCTDGPLHPQGGGLFQLASGTYLLLLLRC